MSGPARGISYTVPSAENPWYKIARIEVLYLGNSQTPFDPTGLEPPPAPSAAIPDLTGAVGTANNAMTAVVNVAAAPADATALAAELNATTIPAINNNLADLQAKLNAALAALRAFGVILP